MVRIRFSVAMLALSLITSVNARNSPQVREGPLASGTCEETRDCASMLNLENAIKLYLAAKGSLSSTDLSSAASPLPERRGKHGADARHQGVPCYILEGCVTLAAKIRFLGNKFIPGSDNIHSTYFKTAGHQFNSLADPGIINNDFKLYLLSRPKFAVPDVVRQLLLPEGDSAWPGGGEGDRSPYFTTMIGSQLWEADIAPVKGAESALPPPSAALPYKEEKEEETTAYDSEMSAEDLLDYLLSFMLSH